MRRVAAGSSAGAAVALVLCVAVAGASHSVLEHVSQGGDGDNAIFTGASADGAHAFFVTDAQLAETDEDTAFDLYDRTAGQTVHVSRGAVNGNSDSGTAMFVGASADGSRVWFSTTEPLVAADLDTRVDLYQRSGGVTTQVSAGNSDDPADDPVFLAASTTGDHVFFRTRQSLLSSDADVDRIDIYDRAGASLAHVNDDRQVGTTPEDALFRGISEDGAHVFFDSFEDIVATDDEPGGAALDAYEAVAGETFHVSAGSNALVGATNVGASADGSRVFFATSESHDAVNDTDAATDVYERSGGATTLISRGALTGSGTEPVTFLDASADGSRVLFSSTESLAATDTDASIDLYERASGATTQLSRGAVNGNGAWQVTYRGASADGNRVFFDTEEALVSADADAALDVYERAAGQTTRVSPGTADAPAEFGGVSRDGARVFFRSAERLASSDTDDAGDVYAAGVAQAASTPTATPTSTATPTPGPATAPVVATPVTPPPPAAGGLAPRAPTLVGSRTIRVRRGTARLTLSCAGPAPCRGSARLAAGGRRLGSAPYRIAAGRRAQVRIRLTAAGRRLVARRRLRATLTLRQAGAPAHRVALTLRRAA